MNNTGLPAVKAVMCDFYGTVVDMQRGLTDAMGPYLQSKGYTANPPARVVTWWRRAHFENSMIDALLHRGHTPYREIGREALTYTFDRAGINYAVAEVDRLVSQIERLTPFPDVVDALGVLKAQGLQLAILSNGDPDMLTSGVSYSGTDHLWHRVISAAEAGTFKPHAAAYATAAEAMGLKACEILFIANHIFDCVGAKAAGMNTAFVNRRRRPFGNIHYPPDLIVEDFTELAMTITTRLKAHQEPG